MPHAPRPTPHAHPIPQAAFTIKELREQAKLDGCDTVIHVDDVALTDTQTAYINAKGPSAPR